MRISSHRTVAPVVFLLALWIVPAAAAPPTLEERIERLVERLEESRENRHIPGMAIAVVMDDEVVLARGFGLADIENEKPVTPETIFAIGSTTKAITASLIGMLVDERRMSWDDPAAKFLPHFAPDIESDDEADEILIRDMLCHRTGFTRMSLLWASGEVPREEILRTACDAEPFAPFRKKFLYNNVMYLAAGMCAAAAAESTWEDLMRERIFEPLRMTNSTLTVPEAQQDPRLALGYAWDDEEKSWEHQPMRNIDYVGPAGSVNSNVLDMANWVRFQLGRGEFAGTRLLSEANHAETWSPQITIAGPVKYGFGWMLREWNEMKVVEHGGNIDGFAAEVALLPEKNVGFVLLANISYSPLHQEAIDIVFDSLVGEWDTDTDAADDAGESLDDYLGVYIANYAQFENEEFTVAVNDDGELTIDIPSQMTFSLGPPDERGRRPFKGFPIAASFERDGDRVIILRLYQGGLQFEIPRKGYKYPIEIPLADLEKYRGTYRFEEMNHDVTVLTKNNHLAIDVPNQLVFELHPPDDEGKWVFRNSDEMTLAVTFAENEFGEVESMTLDQAGQKFTMPKIRGTSDEPLPTLDEIMTLRRVDEQMAALREARVIQMTGTARFVNSGIEGAMTVTFDAGERSRGDVDLGKFGSIRTAINGDEGWLDISFSPFEEIEGKWLEQARREHPAATIGDWRDYYDEILVQRLDEIDGRGVIVVRMRAGKSPPATHYVDATTGDVLKVESAIEVPGLDGVTLPVTTEYGDYHEINGVRIAFTMTQTTEQNGRMAARFDSVRTNVDVDEAFFTLTREEDNDGE